MGATGGGRDGHVATADGAVDLTMAPPTELGGSGEGNNPEQLFAAGYAACFHSALQSAARSKKVTIDGSSVGARVSLVRSGEESIDLAVDLEVIIPGLERAGRRAGHARPRAVPVLAGDAGEHRRERVGGRGLRC